MTQSVNLLEKMANYNHWAQEQLLNHLENLPATVPATSLQLLSHTFMAQAIWLSCLQHTTYPGSPSAELSLPECRQLHEKTSPALIAFTALSAENLMEVIYYINTLGAAYENTIYDILIHGFNHGTYHRAQIARDLPQHHLTPFNTDYINYVRK